MGGGSVLQPVCLSSDVRKRDSGYIVASTVGRMCGSTSDLLRDTLAFPLSLQLDVRHSLNQQKAATSQHLPPITSPAPQDLAADFYQDFLLELHAS